jgi:hypothetical protein
MHLGGDAWAIVRRALKAKTTQKAGIHYFLLQSDPRTDGNHHLSAQLGGRRTSSWRSRARRRERGAGSGTASRLVHGGPAKASGKGFCHWAGGPRAAEDEGRPTTGVPPTKALPSRDAGPRRATREKEFIGVRYLSGDAERGEKRAASDLRCHSEVAIIESLTSRRSETKKTDYAESERGY